MIHGHATRKHGRTKLHNRWVNIRQRCLNPKHPNYDRYGGRGINICSEWDEFANFRNWSEENGYSDELEIDRIDNNKGYYPDNCRYITKKNNSLNRHDSLTNRFTKEQVDSMQYDNNKGNNRHSWALPSLSMRKLSMKYNVDQASMIKMLRWNTDEVYAIE